MVGGSFYNQGFVLDPGANLTGVVASNAACAVGPARESRAGQVKLQVYSEHSST